MNQITLGLDPLHKKTRKEVFLEEMNKVVPWHALVALIQPHARGAHQALGGRPPFAVETMLRIHCLQLWWNLSDPAMEEELHERPLYRRFVGLDGAARLPDESTILRFRHLLEKHRLAEGLFAEVRALLEEKKLLLKSGTIVDATIIAAPPSTKNAAQERDPEMKQTRKGKQWHFGMKLHVGTDRRGLVHSVVSGPASEGDITRLDDLLHGQEREIFGDQAYWSEDHRQHCRHAGIAYRINRRAKPGRTLTAREKAINRSRSRHRARGEHAFHVVKRLWGFSKVRYRGLYKNTVRALTMFALSNLYLARRLLMPQRAQSA